MKKLNRKERIAYEGIMGWIKIKKLDIKNLSAPKDFEKY